MNDVADTIIILALIAAVVWLFQSVGMLKDKVAELERWAGKRLKETEEE